MEETDTKLTKQNHLKRINKTKKKLKLFQKNQIKLQLNIDRFKELISISYLLLFLFYLFFKLVT